MIIIMIVCRAGFKCAVCVIELSLSFDCYPSNRSVILLASVLLSLATVGPVLLLPLLNCTLPCTTSHQPPPTRVRDFPFSVPADASSPPPSLGNLIF